MGYNYCEEDSLNEVTPWVEDDNLVVVTIKDKIKHVQVIKG